MSHCRVGKKTSPFLMRHPDSRAPFGPMGRRLSFEQAHIYIAHVLVSFRLDGHWGRHYTTARSLLASLDLCFWLTSRRGEGGPNQLEKGHFNVKPHTHTHPCRLDAQTYGKLIALLRWGASSVLTTAACISAGPMSLSRLFLHSTAFGLSRALQRLQQHSQARSLLSRRTCGCHHLHILN